MSFYPNRNWLLDVALGEVPGFSAKILTGVTFSMGTSWMSLWDETDALIDLGLQTTPSTVKVASTDVDDTDTTGSGARTVTIYGLDASGNLQEEVIALTGQTEVTSSSVWSAIHEAIVQTAGASNFNEGGIWVGNGAFVTGVPATKYLLVDPEMNISHTLVYTVPAGKRAMVVTANLSSSDLDKGYTVRLCVKPPTGLPLYSNLRGMAGGNNLNLEPKFGPVMSAGTTFTAQAKAEQGTGGNLAVVTEVLLIDD
jgi:hypothetical protein